MLQIPGPWMRSRVMAGFHRDLRAMAHLGIQISSLGLAMKRVSSTLIYFVLLVGTDSFLLLQSFCFPSSLPCNSQKALNVVKSSSSLSRTTSAVAPTK